MLTHEHSAKSNSVSMAIITIIVQKYYNCSINKVTMFKRSVNSDHARHILDGRADARIIELACGPVPGEHSRRMIRLLENEMHPDVEKIVLVMDNLNIHKPVSLYKKYPPEKLVVLSGSLRSITHPSMEIGSI